MNKTGVGDVQVGGQNVNLFPIPLLSDIQRYELIELAKELLARVAENEDVTILETRINSLIYDMYNLSKDEINYIEDSIKSISSSFNSYN